MKCSCPVQWNGGMRGNELGDSLGPGGSWRNRRGARIGGISDDQHVFQGRAFGPLASPAPWVWPRPARAGGKRHEAVRRRVEGRQGEQHHQRHDMAGVPEAVPHPEGRRRGAGRSSCRRARAGPARARSGADLSAEAEAHAIGRSPDRRRPVQHRRRRPRRAAPATRWSGSTPRASPTPIIIPARAGTARPSRAPICARPTPAPPATTPRRAGRNSRSRCSRVEGAARRSRGHRSVRARGLSRGERVGSQGCGGTVSRSASRAIGAYFSSSAISGRQSGSCALSANWAKRRKL